MSWYGFPGSLNPWPWLGANPGSRRSAFSPEPCPMQSVDPVGQMLLEILKTYFSWELYSFPVFFLCMWDSAPTPVKGELIKQLLVQLLIME